MRTYTEAMRGAYLGFFENNIQADFVHIDDIDAYELVYLPYPIHLRPESADRIKAFVAKGGRLICEGLPGYFGAHGSVDTVQPGQGLAEVFGALQSEVLFAPDILDDLCLTVRGHEIAGSTFRQDFTLTDGIAAGRYSDHGVAAVTNNFGSGKTLLIGTYPSIGFARHASASARAFFSGLLDWGGVAQRITVSTPRLTARLQDGAGGRFVFVLNHTRSPQAGALRFHESIKVQDARPLWGGTAEIRAANNTLNIEAGARDALVLALS
jgi:beta-galactosidase